jgi:hypothetical protein
MNFFLKRSIVGVLIVAVFSVGLFATPQRAHAFLGLGDIVHDPINWIENAASALFEANIFTKEYILDTLAWQLINLILEKMLDDVTAWINSGFEGKPAFLDDPKSFLRDVADIAAGEVLNRLTDLNGDGSGWLCRPIDFQIRYILHIYTYNSRDYQNQFSCRLSKIVDNVEDFYNNRIKNGGILALRVAFHNNPFAEVSSIQTRIEQEIRTAESRQKQELAWGRGFLGKKTCLKKGDTNADGKPVLADEHGQQCSGPVKSPGTVIQGKLESTLNIPEGRLTIADELDEAISALLRQVVLKVIGSDGGLISVGGGGGGGGGLPFEPTSVTTPANTIQALVNQTVTLANRVASALDNANAVVANAPAAVNALNTAIAVCNASGNTGQASTLTEMRTQASGAPSAAAAAIPVIQGFQTDLNLLQGRINTFGQNATEFSKIVQEFNEFQTTVTNQLTVFVQSGATDISTIQAMTQTANDIQRAKCN